MVSNLVNNLKRMMNIDVEEQKKALQVMEAVNNVVYEQIISYFKELEIEFKTPLAETFVLQGSVAEGTKIDQPDEFDYGIMFELPAERWEITGVPDYRHDMTSYRDNVFKTKNSLSITERESNRCMNPKEYSSSELFYLKSYDQTEGRLVRIQDFGERVFKTLTEKKRFGTDSDEFLITKYEDHLGGPAMTITVEYENGSLKSCRKLDVDYVLVVSVGGRCFVRGHTYSEGSHWRQSFSRKETDIFKICSVQSPQYITLYKSLKVGRFYISQLNEERFTELMKAVGLDGPDKMKFLREVNKTITTYRLKNLLFHLRAKLGDNVDLITLRTAFYARLLKHDENIKYYFSSYYEHDGYPIFSYFSQHNVRHEEIRDIYLHTLFRISEISASCFEDSSTRDMTRDI